MKLNRKSYRFYTILLLILISYSYSFSQTDSIHQSKWSVGINSGIIFPSPYGLIEPSYNITADLSFHINSKFNVFLGAKYNFIQNGDFNVFELDGLKREDSFFYELLLGGRYYFNQFSPFCFGDASIKYYHINKQIVNGFWEVENVKLSDFGFQIGIGMDIKVINDFFINTHINYSYLIANPTITYYEINAGLKYSF